jgi:hypothetical protein
MARVNVRLLLHGVLGPFSGLAMRTGRTARMDRRLARWLPTRPWVLAPVAATLLAGGAGVLFADAGNLHVLFGTVLIRAAAAIAAAVLWTMLAPAATSPLARADSEI